MKSTHTDELFTHNLYHGLSLQDEKFRNYFVTSLLTD